MAGGTGVPGIPLALIGVGAVLVYSGVQNQTITQILTSAAKGKAPTPGPAGQYVAGNSGSKNTAPPPVDTKAHTASARKNQAIAKLLAAPYGWSIGTEWQDLVSLWNTESGWDNYAYNPSGAFGIAQALNKGNSSVAVTLDVHNSGTGTTTVETVDSYPSKLANEGVATAQIKWGLSYIKGRYGDPKSAWAHEVANNWY